MSQGQPKKRSIIHQVHIEQNRKIWFHKNKKQIFKKNQTQKTKPHPITKHLFTYIQIRRFFMTTIVHLQVLSQVKYNESHTTNTEFQNYNMASRFLIDLLRNQHSETCISDSRFQNIVEQQFGRKIQTQDDVIQLWVENMYPLIVKKIATFGARKRWVFVPVSSENTVRNIQKPLTPAALMAQALCQKIHVGFRKCNVGEQL